MAELALGTAPLGNMFVEVSDEDAFAVLAEAWDAGIRTFDTAPHYGVGLAERRLGEFLRTKPRDSYTISTKVGRRLVPDPSGAGRLDGEGFVVPATTARVWDFSADGIRRSLDESLERLGLDRVDVLYVHDPERAGIGIEAALATAIPALADLRGHGVVDRVGIGSMVNEAITAAARTGAIDLAMIANRVTLADHSALDVAVPACRAAGVAVAAAAVFNSGLLASPTPAADGRFDYADVPPEVLDRVRRIAAVCANHGTDLPTAALHFPLRVGARVVVIGANAPGQVAQNRARLDAPVPEALWAELAAEGLVIPTGRFSPAGHIHTAQAAAPQSESSPTIIDAHVHLWDPADGYAWQIGFMPELRRVITAADVRVELDAAGVDSAILVQADDTTRDTERMLAAAAHPWVSAVVGWLPLHDTARAAAELDRLGAHPKLRGIRTLVHVDPRRDLLELPQVRASLARVAARGLAFEVPDAWPGHLMQASALAADLPGLTVVIDHLAKPPFGGADWNAWAATLRDVAARPNTVAKVSGLHARGVAHPVEVVRPAWDLALELFGPDRLMYGSDWPMTAAAGGYAATHAQLSALIGELAPAEQSALWHGTAARVYGL